MEKSNVSLGAPFLFSAAMLFTSLGAVAEEISLLDNSGESVAYIAIDDELTIYLWSGKPVAYLDDEDVYGFNGDHLGWFLKGAIYDHEGDVICALKGRHPNPRYEGYKGYKEYKPYKDYKEYAPYKPYFSNSFSSIPCGLALSLGAK